MTKKNGFSYIDIRTTGEIPKKYKCNHKDRDRPDFSCVWLWDNGLCPCKIPDKKGRKIGCKTEYHILHTNYKINNLDNLKFLTL